MSTPVQHGAPTATAKRAEPALPSGCATGGCGCSSAGNGGARAIVRVHRERPSAFAPVVVNGIEISPRAIAEEAQQHPAPQAEAAWIAAARALAIRELLLQEARRLGIEPEPEVDEQGRAELEDEALIRALLEQEAAPAKPSENECRRYYEARMHLFRTPDLFEAAHILIEPAPKDEVGWAAAEALARRIAREVGADRDAFAEAARLFSCCPSAQQGGSLGQLRRGEVVPAVDLAIAALPDGGVTREPVQSRFGWHVVRRDRRIEGRQLPFDLVKNRIADLLEARAWAVSAARYAALLAQRARVEGVVIDPSALASELA